MSRTNPGLGHAHRAPFPSSQNLAHIPKVDVTSSRPPAAAPAPDLAPTDKTRTLRGMGPRNPPRAACPACHVAQDAAQGVDATIALTFGAALVLARGVQAFSLSLCPRHRSMMRALENELAHPEHDDE